MASTTAMFTALSGLNANARNLDVIGNNIANVNTTAYKSNRMLFASTFSRTFSLGTVPGDTSGGTNPGQIGLGVSIAGTQRDFSTGAISSTGDARDLAIEGNGFFVVQRGAAEQLYTRAGAFRQNSQNDLVAISGERVMGYAVDDKFNVVEGELVPLNIPVGTLTLAEATTNVRMAGNLNASGDLPTQGTSIVLAAMQDISGGLPLPATGASLLTDIEDPANLGNPLYTVGQTIEISGVEKGNKIVPDARLAVTATTTVQDLLNFFDEALGIANTGMPNPDGATPGVTIDAAGVVTIVGNVGESNHIDLSTVDVRLLDSAGALVSSPITATTTATADGESVRTSFVVYDSLGTPITVDVTMVLDSLPTTGPVWRYFAESAEDSDVNLEIGNGTLQFDTNGQLSVSQPVVTLSVDRVGTGAGSPLTFELAFTSDSDNVTSLTDVQSQLAATFQDGSSLGTLTNYSVGEDGLISGSFTNGLTRTVGKVVLAKFANPEGLVDVGGNMFQTGPNSGTAVVTEALSLGTGKIIGGALELSNVDLSEEFINMIQASTGYSASSRVIQTTDQLIQQLLVIGR